VPRAILRTVRGVDDFDPEAQLLRQIRRRRIGLAIGLSLVASVAMYPCCSLVCGIGSEMQRDAEQRAEYEHEATPEQRAEVEHAIAEAEASLPARNASYLAAIANVSALIARPDLGPCPVHIPLRASSSAQDGFSISGSESFETLAIPGQHSFPWARSPIVGDAPRVAYAREHMQSLRESIARPGRVEDLARIVDSARELSGAFWTWDVVIVPEIWRMPTADPSGATFDGGYARGMAYLYDYATNTVLCAGYFETTTTSDRVDYTSQGFDPGNTLEQMLETEMEGEIERAISRTLIDRAGPPLPPATSESTGAPL
jgi:hypothetical protein